VLPVSYERAAAEIAVLLQEESFDAALLLGVAQSTPVIRIEQFARWHALERPDADAQVPGDATLPSGGREQYPATLPLEPLLADLTAGGVPSRLSDDAGRYVCNHTYYAALHAIAAHDLRVRCLFVHVPADPETLRKPGSGGPTMPLARQIEAVGLVLSHLLA
jgi:pyroglutamyl-peptidase